MEKRPAGVSPHGRFAYDLRVQDASAHLTLLSCQVTDSKAKIKFKNRN